MPITPAGIDDEWWRVDKGVVSIRMLAAHATIDHGPAIKRDEMSSMYVTKSPLISWLDIANIFADAIHMTIEKAKKEPGTSQTTSPGDFLHEIRKMFGDSA